MYSPEARQRISLRYLSLFNNLGHALRTLEMFDEAIEMHENVLALSPNYNQANLALGFVYIHKCEWSLAMKHLDLMFEQHLLGRELNTITENLMDNHVLKYYADNGLSCDEPDFVEEPFANKELVEKLCNQAPIDVLKNLKISKKKDTSSVMDIRLD